MEEDKENQSQESSMRPWIIWMAIIGAVVFLNAEMGVISDWE